MTDLADTLRVQTVLSDVEFEHDDGSVSIADLIYIRRRQFGAEFKAGDRRVWKGRVHWRLTQQGGQHPSYFETREDLSRTPAIPGDTIHVYL